MRCHRAGLRPLMFPAHPVPSLKGTVALALVEKTLAAKLNVIAKFLPEHDAKLAGSLAGNTMLATDPGGARTFAIKHLAGRVTGKIKDIRAEGSVFCPIMPSDET